MYCHYSNSTWNMFKCASIPVNIECSKKIGVPEDVAETAIPLGTSFHKDGSIIGSVFKIMFLVVYLE